MAEIYGTTMIAENRVEEIMTDITIRSLLGNLQEEAIRGNKMMTQMQSFLFGPDISEPCNTNEPPKNLCDDIRRLLELLIDTNNRAESVLHILGV